MDNTIGTDNVVGSDNLGGVNDFLARTLADQVKMVITQSGMPSRLGFSTRPITGSNALRNNVEHQESLKRLKIPRLKQESLKLRVKLTDQLSEPGAPEQIIYYHIIPEYQTEESMYNAVRRFGKIKYDTLRLPHKVVALEADGSVKFGSGDTSAYLFDPDIYTDGRISVQGIDGVLFPEEEKETVKKPTAAVKVVTKARRGMFLFLN